VPPPGNFKELAAHLGCSAEYVARVRAAPRHAARYVARLRLLRATDRILDGATSLTDVALEAGFANHSHLSSTFSREMGATPREARRGPAGERVRFVLNQLAVSGAAPSSPS
jgi:transcriptional regulator GlxA family with amidase domain